MGNNKDRKRYLVWKNYDSVEKWDIFNESDSWAEAVEKRDEAMYLGFGEVLIAEYCPVVCIDGRQHSNQQ